MRISLGSAALRAAAVIVLALVFSALPAAAATYEIDGVHSSAIFKVKHFGVANFYGMFKDISGRIDYDPESAENLRVQVSIGAASVDSRAEQRDNHIKSPDFLNAAEFPTISFKSTNVTPAGDGKLTVVGDLTLHGVTKEIEVMAERTGEGKNPRSGKDMVGFETRFEIDRTQFGMGFMAGPLSEKVTFLLSLEAAK